MRETLSTIWAIAGVYPVVWGVLGWFTAAIATLVVLALAVLEAI